MEHSAHHKETIVKRRITPFPLSSPHSGAHRSAHLDLNYASCPRTLMQPFYPPAGDSRGSWGRNILCLLFWKLPISRPVPCYTFWCLAICQRSLNFTLGERADPSVWPSFRTSVYSSVCLSLSYPIFPPLILLFLLSHPQRLPLSLYHLFNPDPHGRDVTWKTM